MQRGKRSSVFSARRGEGGGNQRGEPGEDTVPVDAGRVDCSTRGEMRDRPILIVDLATQWMLYMTNGIDGSVRDAFDECSFSKVQRRWTLETGHTRTSYPGCGFAGMQPAHVTGLATASCLTWHTVNLGRNSIRSILSETKSFTTTTCLRQALTKKFNAATCRNLLPTCDLCDFIIIIIIII